jgi:hypothetical protein
MLGLDFKRFSFNHVNDPHYWLIENQSIFTNKSRNAMILTYDFFFYSEVIREIMYLLSLVIKKKRGTAG